MSALAPRLVLAAHGSSDPSFADVVADLGEQVRRLRPDLDVRVGYLDHGPPHLADVVATGAVVVPVLLSCGHHVTVDIPAQASGCRISAAAGPDSRLIPVLVERLRDAGWVAGTPVVLAAAGSTEESALQEVRELGTRLSDELGAEVTAAFISAGTPRLDDLLPVPAIASYLLAPGIFSRVLERSGAGVVSAPIGAAPKLAAIVLDRYLQASGQPGRTAPMYPVSS